MNRIKDLRLAKGLSTTDLAKRVGTTQSQISKLELGRTRLTEDWMRRLAVALECRPLDLLAHATLAEIENDVEPHSLGAHPELESSLQPLGLTAWQIATNVVEQSGFPKGTIVMVNTKPEEVEKLKTGDIILARIRDASGETRMILRGYFAPSSLLTNRQGVNSILNKDDVPFELTILGIAVKK